MQLIRAPMAALVTSFVTNYYWLGQERRNTAKCGASAAPAAPTAPWPPLPAVAAVKADAVAAHELHALAAPTGNTQRGAAAAVPGVLPGAPLTSPAACDVVSGAPRPSASEQAWALPSQDWVEPGAGRDAELPVPGFSSTAHCEVIPAEAATRAPAIDIPAPEDPGGELVEAEWHAVLEPEPELRSPGAAADASHFVADALNASHLIVDLNAAAVSDLLDSHPFPGEASLADPFLDAVNAGCGAALLLRDMALFLVEGSVAQIWQWPVDNSTSLPLLSVEGQLADQVAELPEWLVSGLAAAGDHVSLARVLIGERAALLLEERLSLEALAHLRSCRDAVRQFAEAVWAELEAMRLGVHGVIQTFLERHPEHSASFSDRDPILVLAMMVATASCTAWELCRCAQAALAGACYVASLLFCRCCARPRPAGPDPEDEAEERWTDDERGGLGRPSLGRPSLGLGRPSLGKPPSRESLGSAHKGSRPEPRTSSASRGGA